MPAPERAAFLRRKPLDAIAAETGADAALAATMGEVTRAAWPSIVIAAGAVISVFSVTLVTMYARTRILFSMSRDGMLPPLLVVVWVAAALVFWACYGARHSRLAAAAEEAS